MSSDNSKPLYINAREYLLQKIKKMKPGANQLEPENLLSGKLGMSRETVRKAMSSLIHEGIITRWHGKGNFGHPDVTNLPMRMDINSDFRRLLINAGYRVKSIRSESSIQKASPDMIHRIPEARDEDVVSFRQYFYSEDRLAIHCQVELYKKDMIRMPDAGEYTENINEFLLQHCSKESSHTTAWLKAANNPRVAKELNLPEQRALLEWEEVYYDIFENKLGYVKIFFHPEIMDLSLLLKF